MHPWLISNNFSSFACFFCLFLLCAINSFSFAFRFLIELPVQYAYDSLHIHMHVKVSFMSMHLQSQICARFRMKTETALEMRLWKDRRKGHREQSTNQPDSKQEKCHEILNGKHETNSIMTAYMRMLRRRQQIKNKIEKIF